MPCLVLLAMLMLTSCRVHEAHSCTTPVWRFKFSRGLAPGGPEIVTFLQQL